MFHCGCAHPGDTPRNHAAWTAWKSLIRWKRGFEVLQFVTLSVTFLRRIYGTLKIIHENNHYSTYRSIEGSGNPLLCYSNEGSLERRNHEQAHCFLVGMVHMGTLCGHCHRYPAFSDE